MKVLRHVLPVIMLLALAANAPAQFPTVGGPGGGQFNDSRDQVKTSVKAAYDKVPQGGDLPVAIVFNISPRWHIWTQKGGTPEGVDVFPDADNTNIEVEAADPKALSINEKFLAWPEPHIAAVAGYSNVAVFQGKAIAYLPVTVAADAPLGPTTINFKLTYQTCDDKTCLQPVDGEQRSLTVEIVAAGQPSTPAASSSTFTNFPTSLFGQVRGGAKAPEIVKFDLFGFSFQIDAALPLGFALLLLVAAIGGFLLNLTPCVLPVIPLKIMGLNRSAGNRRRTFALGFVMALGVVAFWMGLGVAIAAVAGFTATNQLFQYPVFTITVGVIIALMAIGMCGLFSVRLPQFVYAINPGHDTYHGSFGFGIMTAVLSTPCTAPFMGAAAAWSATQSPPTVLAVFAAIGAGMALPYLILAAFPQLVERMPRTGPASELIKQVMGLLMLAAAAYFIGVGISGAAVSPPDPPSRLYWWAVGLFGVAAGAWLAFRTWRISRRALNRIVFGGIGLAMLAISAYVGVRMTDHGPIDWVYYTHDRFDQAKQDGKVVVMEFTAEWCLNCKALEESVLRREQVVNILASDDVVPIKVDLTGNNTAGNAMLGDVNRLTIPLLVIFSPDGTEVFKGDFYTVEQVVQAVNEARSTKVASRTP